MSAPTYDELRQRAAEHGARLAVERFLTVQDLAARWGCAESTVREIPRERLPWTALGRGGRRTHRRYDPVAVEAFERGEEPIAITPVTRRAG